MNDEQVIAKIAALQAKYEPELLRYPNVIGTGIGICEVAGKSSGELCLRVMVSRKIPRRQLRAADILPRELEGLRVDVFETGTFRA